MTKRVVTQSGRRLSRAGFTLVEAVCSITIVAIIGGVSVTSLVTAVSQYRDTAISTRLYADTSAALDRIAKEVRGIALNSTGDGPAIATLAGSRITTTAGLDLTLSNTGSLMLTDPTVPGQSYALLDNVTSFAVVGLDQSGTTLTLPLSGAGVKPLRRVEITIATANLGITATLRTRIFLRCMSAGAGL